MGVELKAQLEERITRLGPGGVSLLPQMDGPIVSQFEKTALANALLQEVARAQVMGWPRISIHMDLLDAVALAAALKGL